MTYVICAPLEDTSVTCMYAFITGKSQDMYEELFRSLNSKCSQLSFQLDPSVVISHFEQAVTGAVVTYSVITYLVGAVFIT